MTVQSEIITIPVIRTPSEMQTWSRSKRAEGRTIGCVPTMGALHEGHLSLIRASAAECDETIVTIFVNPLQFGKNEDLRKYPGDEEKDLRLAKDAGGNIVYTPDVDDMYQHDRSVYVVEESLSSVLCGKSRPIHFKGVTTVVAKLFNACLPDKAYFGQKDYQQLLVIKRMVRDLDFPLDIVSCPIIRETDGLAMSSRNKYLAGTDRQDALCLKNALDSALDTFQSGERNPRELERIGRDIVNRVGSVQIDYIECRDAEDLTEIKIIERPAVIALAVFVGDTRLIDNIILTPGKEGQ